MERVRPLDKSLLVRTCNGVYSSDGKNRSKLTVTWENPAAQRAVVIGINPSKGNDIRSDRTLTLTARYLHTYGFDEFLMLNIFENYSTDPAGIDKSTRTDFVQYLDELESAAIILIAWGVSDRSYRAEKEQILKVLEPYRDKLYCVENPAGRKPVHPRRISYEFDLVPF